MRLNEINHLQWENEQSDLFLNPKFSHQETENIFKIASKINEKSHIFMATSGTSSSDQTYKLVALHKNAFLCSSQSVNSLFGIDAKDIILNLLPLFHVGGLSLFSRAFCAGATIKNIWNKDFKWNPAKFVEICTDSKITVTSLVPTQVFDLISGGYKSPLYLRCIFIGGGSLSADLFLTAQQLGWNLFPTYGMTECCSQVATMLPVSKFCQSDHAIPTAFSMTILPHLSVSIDEQSYIHISGSSLLSYYLHIDGHDFKIDDPKVNQTLTTKDLGKLNLDHTLQILGRADDNIKINGEFVHLLNVNHLFQTCKKALNANLESTIIALPHERSGHHLIAVFLKSDLDKTSVIHELQIYYNRNVMPYERIHSVVFVDDIPKTELGKIKVNLLKQIVSTL